MTFFLKRGNDYSPSSKEQLDLHETLPIGTYIVQKNPMTGAFYLTKVDSLTIPPKLYGNTLRHTERILNTFETRTSSTGVMLNGEKGSGKTLLGKNLSVEGASRGIVTVLINQPFCGDDFNKLIQQIEQPAIILFDEFEKVYDSDDQQHILTLLDGVFPCKKLFVLTCNDKWRVDQHMRNRPGRIFYMIDFKGIEPEFIREYCADNLQNQKHVERLIQISGMFDTFNFDMLKALVEEMNRYNETPQEAMALLNAKPEYGGSVKYTVRLFIDDDEIVDGKVPGMHLNDTEWSGNPLTRSLSIDYSRKNDSDGDYDWEEAEFTPADLRKIEGDGRVYIFANKKNERLMLTREVVKTYNSYDYL